MQKTTRDGILFGCHAFVLLILTGTLSITLGLSGCKVGPNYSPPPLKKWKLFQNKRENFSQKKNHAAQPALDTWWKGFKDPKLNQIINNALSQNFELSASMARVYQARAVARHAGANLYPTMGAIGGALPIHQSLENPIAAIAKAFPGFKRNITLYEVGAVASWEIDLFGGLRRGKEFAVAEAQVAEAQHLGTRIMISADAADAYFQIRGYQNRLTLAQAQVKTNRKLLHLVNIRRRNGVATDREVAQTEALLASTRTNIPPLRIQLEAQLNRLDVLMGLQPGSYGQILASHRTIPQIPPVSTDYNLTDLLRRRPDIMAAERQLQASSATIGIAIAEYYPKVSLLGLVGFDSMHTGHLFTQTTFEPAAIAGLYWRLFDFGKIDAEVARAKGANAEALAQYRQTILRATEDVENSFMALAQYQIQVNDLIAQKKALIHVRNLSLLDYKQGVVSLIDVLNAERELLTVRDHLIESKVNVARAAASTFRALGGGW